MRCGSRAHDVAVPGGVMLRRLSLRARLSILAVALVAAGLVAVGIATHFALRSFLVDRVDEQFSAAEVPTLVYLTGDRDPGARDRVANALPLGAYAAIVGHGDDVAA